MASRVPTTRLEVPRWMVPVLADVLRQEARRIEADASQLRRGSLGHRNMVASAQAWRELAMQIEDQADGPAGGPGLGA